MASPAGCGGNPYSFKEPIDEIESIEIVSAENSLEFTVLKTLSEEEQEDFLERFHKYLGARRQSVPKKKQRGAAGLLQPRFFSRLTRSLREAILETYLLFQIGVPSLSKEIVSSSLKEDSHVTNDEPPFPAL